MFGVILAGMWQGLLPIQQKPDTTSTARQKRKLDLIFLESCFHYGSQWDWINEKQLSKIWKGKGRDKLLFSTGTCKLTAASLGFQGLAWESFTSVLQEADVFSGSLPLLCFYSPFKYWTNFYFSVLNSSLNSTYLAWHLYSQLNHD